MQPSIYGGVGIMAMTKGPVAPTMAENVLRLAKPFSGGVWVVF